MALFTVELRNVCEVAVGNKFLHDYPDVDKIIAEAAPKIFDFNFPIFDENYRPVLEQKIIRHYYTREIGLETVGLFKLKLNTKLNEIMPYYNQLYESELIKYDPFSDTDYTRTHEGENHGTGKEVTENLTKGSTGKNGTSTTDTKNDGKKESNYAKTGSDNHSIVTNDTRDGQGSTTGSTESTTDYTDKTVTANTGKTTERVSDTPQGGLNGITSNNYLTSATITDAETNTNTNVTDKTKNTGTSSDTSTTHDTYRGNTVDSRNYNEQNNGSDTTSDTGNTRTQYNESGSDQSLTNGTRNNSTDGTDKYMEHVFGKASNRSYMSAIQELRDTFLNIDMLVISELEGLFFGLWI